MAQAEAEQLAQELLSTKQRHRKQLEAMATQIETLRVKRDGLLKDVEGLQKHVQAELERHEAQHRRMEEAQNARGKGTSPALSSSPNGDRDGDDGTVTDEQVADALAALLEFSASKSKMSHADR
jgi:hypothetical protein